MRLSLNRLLSSCPALVTRRIAGAATLFLLCAFLQTGCLSRSLTAITIQPGTGSTSVVVGASAQFKAIGTYTESGHASETEDITSQVTWSSTIPAVAAINSSGLATGLGIGQTDIIANIKGPFGDLTATSNIAVTAPSGGTTPRTLNSVTIIPASQTLSTTGQTAQLIAMGTYSSSPTSVDLTSQSTWRSSNTAVAQVNSSGFVTSVGAGSATITAVATGPDGSQFSGSSTITVSSGASVRTLTALNITPGTQTITTAGQAAQLDAIGTYNVSPLTQDLTSKVTWQTSDGAVATVSSSGVVTAEGVGSATITAAGSATDGSVITASATISVTTGAATRTLTSLSIIPTSQTVTAVGETGQYLAIGTYSAPPLTADLTNHVTWVSSDVKVATINGAGLATSIGVGESTITALTTASDGSVVDASATFQDQAGSGQVTLPTLTIYGAGAGAGTVTGPDAINCSYAGPPTQPGSGTPPGTECTGTFPKGTVVTLTEAPSSSAPSSGGSTFDGWSSNCTPISATACTITMNDNATVGAIFDPKNP